MRAVAKYVAVVVALFVVQVLLGALTAHYTVEGQSFFGIPLANLLPYSLTRTWHIQTAMFWIATAFLAAGLFLAPAIGGRRAAVPAARREPAVRRAARGRGRLARRRVSRHPPEAGARSGPSGSGTRATSTWTSAASGRSRSSRAW